MSGSLSIMGYDVVFPEGRKPFPSQLAVLSKCLTAFNKKQNVLIESPTGTGKTLALLTAALTYQKREYDVALRAHRANRAESGTDTKENIRFGISPTEKHLNDVRVHNQLNFPRIYYCSRTHSQIQQVIDELRGMSGVFLEDLHTTILASRAHMCVNSQVRRHAEATNMTIDAACDDALKKNLCPHKFNIIPVIKSLSSRGSSIKSVTGLTPFVNRHVAVPSAVPRNGNKPNNSGCATEGDELLGCSSVWDIEDIVAAGNKHHGCAYFASRTGLVASGGGSTSTASAPATGTRSTGASVGTGGSVANTAPAAAVEKLSLVFPKSQVVFAPYNYMFNPDIREGLGIDLKNSILVVDEAHNVEDICREEMSVEATLEALQVTMHRLYAILNHPSGMGNLPHFKAFHQLCSDLVKWVRSTSALMAQGNSSGGGFGAAGGQQQSSADNVWHGDEIMDTLAGCCGLSAESLPMYREHFNRMQEQDDISYSMAMHTIAQQEMAGTGSDGPESGDGLEKEFHASRQSHATNISRRNGTGGAPDIDQDEYKLPKPSVALLSGLLRTARLLCDNNAQYACDFKMVLLVDTASPFSERKPNNASGVKLCLWCMNPAIAFQSIKTQCHSIVLASGTLAPLSSFSAELDTPFSVRLEAPHVINVQKQVHVQALANFNHVSLNASYANQNNPEYQTALGELTRLTVKLTPGGVLLFFPSYGLLTKMKNTWTRSGLIPGLSNDDSGAGAEVFTEPKDAKSLEVVLKSYYSCIDNGRKAVLLAVCRGKVSEGINFENDYARCIIVVGIPFPAAFDLAIQLKKKHQDERVSKWIAAKKQQQSSAVGSAMEGLDATINGNDWYKLQAFRAINQALGRCIRHIRDYGAILLCDPRYQDSNTQAQLSRWVRSGIRNVDNFEDGVVGFHGFFREAEMFVHSKFGVSAGAVGATSATSVTSAFLVREHARLNPAPVSTANAVGRKGTGRTTGATGSMVKKFKVPSSTRTSAARNETDSAVAGDNDSMGEDKRVSTDASAGVGVGVGAGAGAGAGLRSNSRDRPLAKKPFKIPKTILKSEGPHERDRDGRGSIMAAFGKAAAILTSNSDSNSNFVSVNSGSDLVTSAKCNVTDLLPAAAPLVSWVEPSTAATVATSTAAPHSVSTHVSVPVPVPDGKRGRNGFIVALSDTDTEDEDDEVPPATATDSTYEVEVDTETGVEADSNDMWGF